MNGAGPLRLRGAARGAVAILATMTACGDGEPAAAPPTPIRWLALGDSYSSGEGARDASGRCARTDRAYAPVGRSLVEADLPVAALSLVACSGAKLADLPGQLAEARAGEGESFNLATMTAGGNDVGFADIILDCLGADDLVDRVLAGREAGGCDLPEAEIVARVEGLEEDLVPAYRSVVDALVPGGVLLVVGYPNLYADPETWEPEGRSCEGISAEDADLLRRVASVLDRSVAAAVARVDGAVYVSVLEAFEGHELCGPGEPWLNGLSLSLSTGTFRHQGSFHPNDAGHRAEAELVADVLRDLYEIR